MRFIFLVTLMFISAQAGAGVDAVVPAWVENPPQGQTTACAPLANGEFMAFRIAVAKAKGEISQDRKSEVQNDQTMEQESHNGEKGNVSFKEVTRVRSETTFEKLRLISKQAVVLNGIEQLCILVEPSEQESR